MPYNNVIPGWMLEDPKVVASLEEFVGERKAALAPIKQEEEAKQYVNACEWEGGPIGLLEYGGWEQFPLPLQWIAKELERVYEVFKQAENAYLYRMGVD